MAFVEKTIRKMLRFDLNDSHELDEYNRHLQNPGTKIIDKQLLTLTDSHFEKDYSTTTTHHIAYLEVEECSF